MAEPIQLKFYCEFAGGSKIEVSDVGPTWQGRAEVLAGDALFDDDRVDTFIGECTDAILKACENIESKLVLGGAPALSILPSGDGCACLSTLEGNRLRQLGKVSLVEAARSWSHQLASILDTLRHRWPSWCEGRGRDYLLDLERSYRKLVVFSKSL